MKKVLRFYLKHIFSISLFVFCVVEMFIAGWPMIIFGIVFGGVVFAVEYLLAAIFYKPSKKEIESIYKQSGTKILGEYDPTTMGGWGG